MEVGLSKFKNYPGLSEETIAFNALIFVDGEVVGECSNRGHGDPIRFHFDRKRKEVEDFCGDLEDYFSVLIGNELQKKWVQRQVKKHIIYRLKGDKEGVWWKIPVDEQSRDNMRNIIRGRHKNIDVIYG
jgi:hypothetical protein